MTIKPELKVDNISLHFGGIQALIDVSIDIRQGEILAIIGPNGAGKTCLINSITGFYRPQEGKIYYGDNEINCLPSERIAGLGISRTFQNIELYGGMTTLDNLMTARHSFCKYNFLAETIYFGRAHNEEIKHRRVVEDIIDFLEMEPIRKKVVSSLPYGLQKRVELGRALAQEPDVLLLDEPTAGLNLEEKEDMARFIIDVFEGQKKTYPDTPVLRDGVKSIVLIEHDMGIVMDICHRIGVLDFGRKIAEGSPHEIKVNPAVIEAYLGVESVV